MEGQSQAAATTDLKIMVIGKSGTGKTSYVNKWTKNLFTDSYKETIVSEYGFKIVEKMENFTVYNFGI